MDDIIKSLVEDLVLLIVNKNFTQIVDNGMNGRLSACEIEAAINEYPGTITTPPSSAYDSVYVYNIYDLSTMARKVEFDLWFDGHSSDLTLSVDVHQREDCKFLISIDDIHVL